MHSVYVKKLNAMVRYRKLFIAVALLIFLSVFIGLLLFDSADIKSRTILEGTLVTGSSSMVKTPFQNCFVELENKQVIVARCAGLSQVSGHVKVMRTINSKNKATYSICDKSSIFCITHHSSGTPSGAP